MNKIYKVMYSKVKQCAVVVSEIAKGHGHNGESSSVRKHAALMAAVLIALGSLSIEGMPVAQANDGDTGDASLRNNDFIGANDHYWYYDDGDPKWKEESYSDILIGHRNRKDLPNINGAGAKGTGSIAAGVYAQAGMQSVTIGNRNAGASRGSVFIGEHSGYNDGAKNNSKGKTNHYVTSVGFQSDATGWGSIAIGSNALAENSKTNRIMTDEDLTREENTTKNKNDDVYEIKTDPTIQGASVALGYSAKAQDGNIAIGSYSDTKEGTTKNKTAYTDKEAATSYVSVGNKEKKLQRRITNVADGADATDVATVGQLQKAITDTGVNNKANIDASNIGTNLKQADGITAAELTDITTNENKWGAAIGTGKVADPTKSGKNDPTQNGSQQLVTGGTVYTALQNQKNDLTKDLSVHADWGITITNNYIGLSRNLGNIVKINGERDPSVKIGRYGLILGGEFSRYISYFNRTPLRNTQYGASGDNSVIVGGFDNLAKGSDSVVLGGWLNEATGKYSSVLGGYENVVEGSYSTIMGGHDNFITGTGVANGASIVGGHENVAFAGAVVIGGSGNHAGNNFVDYLPIYSVVIGGSGNQAVGDGSVALGGGGSNVYADGSTGIGGGSTAYEAYNSLAAGPDSTVTVSNGTAIGYKATTNQKGTIAFGHDKGDIYFDTNPRYDVGDALTRWPQKAYRVSQNFYDANGKKITENEYMALMNPDYTWNDYSKRPYFEETYDRAYYNRLVKVADGQKAHDTVVMEQLTPYTKSNASNIGVHLKTYTVGEDGETITEADATPEKQKENKDAWGQALGAGTFTTGTSDKATDASTSDQLVTGSTLYDYDKPTGTLNYVSANNTTGQNLSALDAQVKANADTLNDKTHNIKYYSVDENLPKIDGYTNEGNDGAKGMGSIAAGFNTHADGIASTVAGSYSGVINSKTAGLDLRGATALSYGTFNINQNTDVKKEHSGVANSIIGQANATTDSNAAIIYGAGNTVTNSYRAIDTSKFNLGKVEQDIARKDAAAVAKDLQQAVPTSGGQVMVMGGGNSVDKAYMTQVTGVGNKVSGQDSTYAEGTSTQYNFVDGFQNELSNGKNDYIIGTNNKVSGDSVDKNQSNIIFGDNHKLTNQKNNVIIGSSDEVTEMAGSDAVSIGHNANAGGASVALGSNAVAGGNALAVGPNANAKNNSIALGIHASATSSQNLAIGYYANVTGRPDTIKNSVALGSSSTVGEKDILSTDNEKGVLSIGAKDNERRIIHVRAGVNDTDAVNVSQLKSVQSGLTDKGLTFVTNDGEHTAKLGSKVTIQGTAKKADHEYTADNLTTAIDKDGNITILMDKDISTEKLTVNGKDGKDGQPGTAGSIGIKGQDGEAGIGIDGKNGISIKGKDGKDGVTMKAVDGKDGTEGHIGLTGPKGTNGKDGTNAIDITVKNGYDDVAKGINGTNGVDGKDGITRIVYTDKTGEHQVATMEDGLKFKGDDMTVISKKLNNTMEIIGGANSKNLTDGNIGVNSTDKGQLKVQLAKDLTGITSIGNQKTEGDKTTGAKITLGNDGSVDVNGGKITNVGSGADASGSYTTKTNAANIGDVQKIVKDAVDSASDTTNKALAGKANIDASNIGTNLKDAHGNAASTDAQKANAEKWGSAIGTGEIKADDGRMVTGKTVYDEVRPKNDGSYVKKDKTTGENLSALDTKIGKLDEDGNYIKKDDSVSKNLSTLDTQVKTNADAISKEKTDRENAITNITNNIGDLSDSAVKYDADTNKGKVTLAGADGTTITNLKAGEVTETSKDAVNGSQLYAEQKARTDADTAINNKIGSLDANGNYIKKDDSISKNLSALDTNLKTTSDLIHTNDKGDTIQIGESSSASKIDVHGKDGKGRVITGVVTDAGDPTSAANVGYVNGVTAANTQQIYRDMNNAYGRLNNNINKAAAGSNALAALHPLDYDPDDKADFAVGYGHYRNANAAAVGAFYHPNENTMVNVGVSLGNGDPGFNAGVSFKIGSGSAGREAMSKTEMAKVINSQSKEIDALKKDNADKDKRIDALEQKMAEILAKLDKNGK